MSARGRTRLAIALVALAGLTALVAANAHLVWASARSQPDCVPHLKEPGANGGFRAARSSC